MFVPIYRIIVTLILVLETQCVKQDTPAKVIVVHVPQDLLAQAVLKV